MKKISFFVACATALIAGLTSCSQDRDPVYQVPTKFVLNEPVMQDEYIALEASDEATIELVASQADYGYAAIANYAAQVSFTEDFAKYEEVAAVAPGTTARFSISQFDLSFAICSLMGLTPEDEATAILDYQPLYVRAVSRLEGIESSEIVSNVVKFNHIKATFAVASPKSIYLVGNVSAWSVEASDALQIYENWQLWDEVVGGKNTAVYKGTFNLGNTTDGGTKTFRFYSQLGKWEVGSIGSQSDDAEIVMPGFTNGSLSLVSGKGSYAFPDLADGEYEIIVDMSKKGNWTLTITPVN